MMARRLIGLILTAILVLPSLYSPTSSMGAGVRSNTSISPNPFRWGTGKISYLSGRIDCDMIRDCGFTQGDILHNANWASPINTPGHPTNWSSLDNPLNQPECSLATCIVDPTHHVLIFKPASSPAAGRFVYQTFADNPVILHGIYMSLWIHSDGPCWSVQLYLRDPWSLDPSEREGCGSTHGNWIHIINTLSGDRRYRGFVVGAARSGHVYVAYPCAGSGTTVSASCLAPPGCSASATSCPFTPLALPTPSPPDKTWIGGCQRADLKDRGPANAYKGPDLQVRAKSITALAPERWSGDIATFCDIRPSPAADYKVTVIWDAAGWAGAAGETNTNQPLQNLHPVDGLIDTSPSNISVIADTSKDGITYYRVKAAHSYLYPSIRTVVDISNGQTRVTTPRNVGSYRVLVIVQKATGASIPESGALAMDETTAKVDSGKDVSGQVAGRQLGDQMVHDFVKMEVAFGDVGAQQDFDRLVDKAITTRPYDPWFAVGVLNDLADAHADDMANKASDHPIDLAYDGPKSPNETTEGPLAHFASADHNVAAVTRFFMAALTSGQADKHLSETLVADMLFDGQNTQEFPGWSALARAISENGAAATALYRPLFYTTFVDDAGSSAYTSYRFGLNAVGDWQEGARRIAAAVVANDIGEVVSYSQNSGPGVSWRPFDVFGATRVAVGGPSGTPYPSALAILEKALGDWEAVHMPYPLVVTSQSCRQPTNCQSDPDLAAGKQWAYHIGSAERLIVNAVEGNTADQQSSVDPKTVSIVMGVVFWAALEITAPEIATVGALASLSPEVANSLAGLGGAILQPYAEKLVHGPESTSTNPIQLLEDQRKSADQLLSYLLLKRHGVVRCPIGKNTCDRIPYGLSASHMNDVYKDGDPLALGNTSGQSAFDLTDQHSLWTHAKAQDVLFANMIVALFTGGPLSPSSIH